LLVLLVITVGAQAWEVRFRGIDPDELVHLHTAFSVSTGDLMYRDFFAYHGPGLSYLLQPLFWILGPDLSVLWCGRALNWLLAVAALALTWRVAGRLTAGGEGLAAAALLAWTTIFHGKSIELRPDVPAMLLLVAAAWGLVSAGDSLSLRRCLFAGLLAGFAMLCTQKSVVPAAGLVLAVSVTEGRRRWIAGIVAGGVLGCGVLMAWGVATAWFAWHHAAGDFLHSTLYQLAVIPVRSSRWEHLRPTLSADLSVWVLAGWELFDTWRNRRQPETWSSGRGLIAVLTAWCVFSLLWVKATYPQFYLLWMPFVAILAGRRAVAWYLATGPRTLRERWAWGIGVGGLALLELLLVARGLWLGPRGAFSHLAELGFPTVYLVLGAIGVCELAVVAWVAIARGQRDGAVIALIALGMFYGAFRHLDGLTWSNSSQVSIIRRLHELVPPNGHVLDGFTGLAALRRHAYFFCWINEYSGALMSPKDREERLLTIIQKSPPDAVLFDEHLQRLPDSVTRWIREHYYPVYDEVPHLLMRR
jgi:hypothetical protein